jgi:starvation-inducible DNA-binding protein
MTLNVDLEATVRQQIAQQIALILSDEYILFTKTQNFHWNLIDPRFFSLHKFFEELYEGLAKFIDELAERIRILGERSPGSLKEFLEMSSLEESEGALTGDQMLQELIDNHEFMIRQLRDKIQYVNNFKDDGTGDLFIQILRFHEKSAWMLRSHLK